jgi:hypothetical protein
MSEGGDSKHGQFGGRHCRSNALAIGVPGGTALRAAPSGPPKDRLPFVNYDRFSDRRMCAVGVLGYE